MLPCDEGLPSTPEICRCTVKLHRCASSTACLADTCARAKGHQAQMPQNKALAYHGKVALGATSPGDEETKIFQAGALPHRGKSDHTPPTLRLAIAF